MNAAHIAGAPVLSSDAARQCTHARAGIVTTHPDGPPIDGAHAARNTCDRAACIAAAKQWVAGHANRTAHYVPDGAR